jgi:hypothetical protein
MNKNAKDLNELCEAFASDVLVNLLILGQNYKRGTDDEFD